MNLSLENLRMFLQDRCGLCKADILNPVPLTVTEIQHTQSVDGVVETSITARGFSKNGDFENQRNIWHDLVQDKHYSLCDKCMKEAKKNMRIAKRKVKVKT